MHRTSHQPSHPTSLLSSSSLSFIKMKLKHSSVTLLSISLIFLPSLTSSVPCQKICGKQRINYPFGSGPGCGDKLFQKYITCNQQRLTFTTHTGSYPITAVDYTNQIIYISDRTMSTCFCSQPSKGFGLDWDAPLTFTDRNVFALLDYSISSSPIYRQSLNNNGGNSTMINSLCDNEATPVCSLLFTCRPISTLNLPISTCCVYTPLDLGPSFEMDLEKLKCTSYTGFYGYNGEEYNPEKWNYGVALKYKFNVNNDYPSFCADCERSNGICGYGGAYNYFVCNCPSGVNSSTDCYFEASWSNGSRLLPWREGMN